MNLELLFESYMSCLLMEARDKDYLQKLESKGFQDAQEITDTLVSWDNPKKEKTALHFILNRSLDLSKDLEKFNKAYILIDRQHLDFNKFNSLDEVLNRSDASTERIKAKTSYNPDEEPYFSDKKELGNGTVVYTVENSREGQKAARKAIDLAGYGPEFNGWCLLARKSKFSQRQLDEFSRLSPAQLEKLGYYDEDDLSVAWNYWKNYSAYPKRVAFKEGKIVSFSAGKNEGIVEWWDRDDYPYDDGKIPYCDVTDDFSFLMEYGKTIVANNPKTSAEVLKKLAEDEDYQIRKAVARNKNTHMETLAKLANDKEKNIRYEVAKNLNTPTEVLEKLAEDEEYIIRMAVARNPNIPIEIIEKFAEDEDYCVRAAAITNKSKTPVEVLVKLSEDEYNNVRVAVARNTNTPIEVLEKLAEDNDFLVRREASKNLRNRQS